VGAINLAPRFVLRATLGDAAGSYTSLDPPTAGVTLVLADGTSIVTVTIPPGDPGWVVRNARRGRYRWRGRLMGLHQLVFATRPKHPNDWTVRAGGKNVPGAGALSYDTLSVRIVVGGRCAVRHFHPERTPG
jgi:hypothetical protein